MRARERHYRKLHSSYRTSLALHPGPEPSSNSSSLKVLAQCFVVKTRSIIKRRVETPSSAHEKQFRQLDVLTPGMHGYSMLRTQ